MIRVDESLKQIQQPGRLELARKLVFESDVIVFAKCERDLGKPRVPSHVVLTARDRGEGALARPARVGVVNERALEDRSDMVHDAVSAVRDRETTARE